MTVHFIVSEHSRLQQPAPPTTPPLCNSGPVKTKLRPCQFTATPVHLRSAMLPLEQQRHQCPPLKQENSLIFGPCLPICVFYTKATQCYTSLSSEYNSTD